MLPLILVMSAPARADTPPPPPSSTFTLTVTGSGTSRLVTAAWDTPGTDYDGVSFQVSKVGNPVVQWSNPEGFTAADSGNKAATWGTTSSGYDGPGRYRFFAIFRQAGVGYTDTSNEVLADIG